MSEGLVLAGHRGLYLLELFEIQRDYEIQFASFLTCINDCMGKGFDGFAVEPDSDDDASDAEDEQKEDPFADHMDKVFSKLVETCATLETMMPMQWNTITRNLLLEKPRDLKETGENWVTGLFHVERLHTLIRSMCASKKSHMVGFMNNYRIFTANQLSWRFVTEYANNPRPSALCVKEAADAKSTSSVPGMSSFCLLFVFCCVFFLSSFCLLFVFFLSSFRLFSLSLLFLLFSCLLTFL